MAVHLLVGTVCYGVADAAGQGAGAARGDEDVALNARGAGGQVVGVGSTGIGTLCTGVAGRVDKESRPAPHAG